MEWTVGMVVVLADWTGVEPAEWADVVDRQALLVVVVDAGHTHDLLYLLVVDSPVSLY